MEVELFSDLSKRGGGGENLYFVWDGGKWREGKIHKMYSYIVYSDHLLLPPPLLSLHLPPSKHRISENGQTFCNLYHAIPLQETYNILISNGGVPNSK